MDKMDPTLDNFLECMPLAPLPNGFMQRTMSRVILQQHYRLRFIDFALPLFALLFLPLLLGIAWWVMAQIDPLWLAQARLELHYGWLMLPQAYKDLALLALPLAGMVSLSAMCGGLLMLVNLPYRRSQG